MALENTVEEVNAENAKKESNTPKEPEPETWIGKQLDLIGVKKSTYFAIGSIAIMVGVLSLCQIPGYKRAEKRVAEYPSHIIRMEGIANKKELTSNWRYYFIKNETERTFFERETEKRNKNIKDQNVQYYPCARTDCSPLEHIPADEQLK